MRKRNMSDERRGRVSETSLRKPKSGSETTPSRKSPSREQYNRVRPVQPNLFRDGIFFFSREHQDEPTRTFNRSTKERKINRVKESMKQTKKSKHLQSNLALTQSTKQ